MEDRIGSGVAITHYQISVNMAIMHIDTVATFIH